jgi:hypothetical protein
MLLLCMLWSIMCSLWQQLYRTACLLPPVAGDALDILLF